MHATIFTTILCLAATAASSAVPKPSVILETRAAKYIQYCDKVGGPCGRVESTGKCQSSVAGAPLLFFDKGLKCNVWQQQGCPKSSKNVVKGVEVAFNTKTNPAAHTAGIKVVGSFKC
ncbi:hypothetical protein LTR85_001261 [Meristemomyces frigidus]|nr:hypothetical protein LTR85_001261 [Meristemomyces frigidus]